MTQARVIHHESTARNGDTLFPPLLIDADEDGWAIVLQRIDDTTTYQECWCVLTWEQACHELQVALRTAHRTWFSEVSRHALYLDLWRLTPGDEFDTTVVLVNGHQLRIAIWPYGPDLI